MARFVPLRELAVGGQASVTLARAEDGTIVVLKRCLTRNESDEKRLRDEGRVGKRLRHKSIVRTVDLFEEDGRPVLVLEYVRGLSMAALRGKGPLSAGLCALVGAHIASALAEIHGARDDAGKPLELIHRDVTPANILVDLAGRARLIDLGIAKSRESTATATKTGEVRGTLRYLAPELFRNEKQSRETDIWALGIVILEAALGKPLYSGSTAQILQQLMRPEPVPPDVMASLHPSLRECLEPLLVSDPERREHNAAQAAWRFEAAAKTAFHVTEEDLARHVSACAEGTPAAAPIEDTGEDADSWIELLDARTSATGARRSTSSTGSSLPRPAVSGTAPTRISRVSAHPEESSPSRMWMGIGAGAVLAVLLGAGAFVAMTPQEPPPPPVALATDPVPESGRVAPVPEPVAPPTPTPTPPLGAPPELLPSEVALLEPSSVWRYDDMGTQRGGVNWRNNDFDDSAWLEGRGRFGYGGDGERTLIRFGGDPVKKHITAYFRTSFDVKDPTAIAKLTLRFQRDDGIALYLNGTEIARDGLRAGAGPSELAEKRVEEGTTEQEWVERTVTPALLQQGRNVLAAEVHQALRTSSDLGFDASLTAVFHR